MQKIEKKIRDLENFKSISNFLPDDCSGSWSLDLYLEQLKDDIYNSKKILDLGCGDGNSIDLFKDKLPNSIWHGIDISDSPEVRKRYRKNENMITFDGVNLPFPDDHFDLIYCNQVLEHVRNPDMLVSETFRVLKPNAIFIGSVSYLEPFHSYSIFNFTPYGLVKVLMDAGFSVNEIRPGMDASLLIIRQLFNRSKYFRFLWNRNYIHIFCDIVGTLFQLGHRERNFLKVQFAGHLIYLARVPEIEKS